MILSPTPIDDHSTVRDVRRHDAYSATHVDVGHGSAGVAAAPLHILHVEAFVLLEDSDSIGALQTRQGPGVALPAEHRFSVLKLRVPSHLDEPLTTQFDPSTILDSGSDDLVEVVSVDLHLLGGNNRPEVVFDDLYVFVGVDVLEVVGLNQHFRAPFILEEKAFFLLYSIDSIIHIKSENSVTEQLFALVGDWMMYNENGVRPPKAL